MVLKYKRFLAGVTCAQCKLLDKTILVKEAGIEYTACVRCGYQQQKPGAPSAHSQQPSKIQPIRFVSRSNASRREVHTHDISKQHD